MKKRAICAIALSLVIAGTSGVAHASGPGPVTVPDFDLVAYLEQSPALHEMDIDTSGLRVDLSDYTVKTTSYNVVGAVGYKDTTAANASDYTTTTTSSSRTITDMTSTAYANTHTIEFGQATFWSAKVSVPFLEASAGTTVSFGYSFSNAQTWTEQHMEAVTFSPQSVTLAPWSAARIEEWYDQGSLAAVVTIVGRTSGSIRFTKCGHTVDIPIGQLLAQRDAFNLPPLPQWITPSGDDVLIDNQVTFSTTRATRQAVRVTNATPPTKPTPAATPAPAPSPTSTPTPTPTATPAPSPTPNPATPTPVPNRGPGKPALVMGSRGAQVGSEIRLPMASVAVAGPPAPLGELRSAPSTPTKSTRDAAATLAALPACLPSVADGAVLLGTNGDVYDPAWGSLISAPDGVRFRSASGTNASGLGLYLSAIAADGTPYWRSPETGSFAKVTSPATATMTADGTVLLGSDGRAYFAGGGRVPSPTGVRFSDVSGIHVPGTAVFVSAITPDGQAYWYNDGGALQRVPVPVPVVDTVDGLALLGADGNVYKASTGAKIGNPTNARMTAISGTHKYRTGIRYSAIDEDGDAYWTSDGENFTRVALAIPARSTVDGTVLLGADGRAYHAGSGTEYGMPPRVRFTAVAGVTVWGIGLYVSGVSADGRVYWWNASGTFRQVAY